MTRTVYVVGIKGGFVSSQRFNYKTGYKPGEPVPFDRARLYTRYRDAVRAAKEHKGRVLDAMVTIA